MTISGKTKVLNPCFQNDVCGKYGRCINLYTKFVCDCSDSIFFEGKYCKDCEFACFSQHFLTDQTTGCNSV